MVYVIGQLLQASLVVCYRLEFCYLDSMSFGLRLKRVHKDFPLAKSLHINQLIDC